MHGKKVNQLKPKDYGITAYQLEIDMSKLCKKIDIAVGKHLFKMIIKSEDGTIHRINPQIAERAFLLILASGISIDDIPISLKDRVAKAKEGQPSEPRLIEDNVMMETLPITHLIYHTKSCRIHHDSIFKYIELGIPKAFVKNDVTLIPCLSKDCNRPIKLMQLVNDLPRRFKIVEKNNGDDTCVSQTWDSDVKKLRLWAKNTDFRMRRMALIKKHEIVNPQDCPFPRCAEAVNGITIDNVIVGKSKRQCINCKAQLCPDCNYWYGDPNLEKDHRDRTCATMKLIETDGIEAASIALLSTVSKQCPKCKAPTQRKSGCAKMTCFNCGSYWCWDCEWLHIRGDPEFGIDIYIHMRNKHGFDY